MAVSNKAKARNMKTGSVQKPERFFKLEGMTCMTLKGYIEQDTEGFRIEVERGAFMAKYSFPAIFEKEAEGGFSIYFPDIDGCYTQSEEIGEGIENARDALCLMLYALEKQGKALPTPSSLDKVVSKEASYVALVECETQHYAAFFDEVADRVIAENIEALFELAHIELAEEEYASGNSPRRQSCRV